MSGLGLRRKVLYGRGASGAASTLALFLNFAAMTSPAELAAAGVTHVRGPTNGLATMVDKTGRTTYCPNNLAKSSVDLSDGSLWNVLNTVTLTGGQTDPDGGTTASRLQGTGSSWYFGQVSSVPGNSLLSIWVKSNTGSSQNFRMYMGTFATISSDLVATTSWQKFTLPGVHGASSSFGLLREAASSTCDLLVAFPHLKAVTYETDTGTYYPTGADPYYGPRFTHDPAQATVLGDELFTGSVTSSTGWSIDSGASGSTFGPSSLALSATGFEGVTYNSIPGVVQGRRYQVSLDIAVASGQVAVFLGSSGGGSNPNVSIDPGARTTVTFDGWKNGDNEGRIVLRGNPAAVATVYGVSVKAFDCVPLGLMSEEQGTNLFLHSNAFDNAAWSTISATGVTANATTSPDGTVNADKLLENADNTDHTVYQTVSLTSANYTYSVYVKAAERTWVQVYVAGGTDVGTSVNLATGVFGTAMGSPLGRSIEYAGNGWYRVAITFAATVASWFPAVSTALADTPSGNRASHTGVVTSGVYLYGADIKLGGLSSYIPTGASAVTRAKDEISMTGTDFSSWFNPDEGTFILEGKGLQPGALIGIGDPSTTAVVYTASGGAVEWWNGAHLLHANSGLDDWYTTGSRAVVSYDSTGRSMCKKPGTAVTDAHPLTEAAAADRLTIGHGMVGANYLNGTVASVRYHNVRFSDAQVEAAANA